MDKESFDMIYEQYWLPVYNSAFKRLIDPKKASEITQEAFFQLWLNKDNTITGDVFTFLLEAVKKEFFKLMEKECTYIVNPPHRLFEDILLPGAN